MAKQKGDNPQAGTPTGATPKRAGAAAGGAGAGGGPKADTAAKGAGASGGAKADTAAKGAGAAKGAAGARGAAKGAGKAPAKGAAKSAGRGTRAAAGSGPDLRRDLRDFASGRPDGWNHEDWMGFLEDLQRRGHNVNDRDQIGMMLERERLAMRLEQVPGMGAQRVKAIADRYGYIWRLRETSAEELSREANIPRPLAEKVMESVRG